MAMPQKGISKNDVLDVKNMELQSKRILFAYDNSEHSKKALKQLIKFYLKKNDTLYIINVHPPINAIPQLFGDKMVFESSFMDRVKMLQEIANDIEAKYNIQTFSLVKIGDPKHVILDAIRELKISVLMMGSRGLGTIKGILMGSVSKYCVKNSPVPVTVLS